MNCRFIIVFIALMTTISCAKREDTPLFEKAKEEEKEDLSGIQKYGEEKERIRKSDIGIIDEFTPEIFVKLTILYRQENETWLETARSLEPEEREKYLEKEHRQFFARFGTTEEAYIQYSENNIEKLNKYMSEHPEFLPELQNYD
jgi:hypothetical protein